MAYLETRSRDPALESMRNVEGPPDIEDVVAELRRETTRIHAAFLFDSFGLNALRELCLWISSTKNNFAGWEEFGINLGLNPLLIKCINCNFNTEDPTRNTLLAFVQRDEATVSHIVDALYKIGRHDVIMKLKEQLLGLANRVLETTGNLNNRISDINNEESGYHSISEAHSDTIYDDINRNIIRPLFKPPAPLIFRDIVSDYCVLGPYTKDHSPNVESESYQTAVPTSRKRKTEKQYGRTVLLTFASDGWYTAQQVATVFRKKRENLPRIGVVILNEQSEYVNNCPEQFITAVFNQVDYVVPIITEEYLRTVITRTPAAQSSLQCMDARYIKYIYTLMNTYYMRNGCINDKIRCIVPDSKVHLTQRHPVMAGPLFQVWVRATETEELSHRILRSKF